MSILEKMAARRRGIKLLVCVLCLAASPAMARERKILQKHAAAPADLQKRGADAWIDSGSTATNHGSDTTLRVTSAGGGNQRTLVEFDLSSIPSSGIKLATLSLFMPTAPSASRNYQARRMTSLWTELGASYANRVAATAWGTNGGDAAGATATTATGTTNSVTLNWTVTSDVQRFFGSATPSGDYGWMIRDANENAGTARTGIFSSKEDATDANHPSLTVDFVQNVQGVSATAGNGQITLKWSYPPAIGTVLSATNGVVVVRQATNIILAATVPADGTAYSRGAACTNTVNGATIVFNSPTTSPTTFVDSAAGDNPDCPPANDTLYYYKVYARDAALNYSANGATSNYTPLTLAVPSATVSNQRSNAWLASTGAAALAASGVIPSTVTVIGAQSNLLSGVNPKDGTPVFNPISLGGAVTGRPPVLDSSTAALARNVAYVADGDGFVYAIDASSGDIVWMTNPTGLTTNGFTMGPATVMSSVSTQLGSSYSRATDLVVAGTRNAGSTTANQIVGMDGTSGAMVWQVTGNLNSNPAMDIVVSTPFIDYKNNAIWVTSNSAGGNTQPSLWKININQSIAAATAQATANLGDISNSPVLGYAGDVLFVGNDTGTLYAINPMNAAVLASFAGGDTQVTGSPILLTDASPYRVVFAGATMVQAVTFNVSTKTFASTGAGTWSTTMPGAPSCTPSAPLGFSTLANVYVGCTDGNLYQLDATSGAITGTLTTHAATTVGDPALDVQLSRIMVGNTDGRVFTFTYPF